jgi:uncharacterized protein YkwD
MMTIAARNAWLLMLFAGACLALAAAPTIAQSAISTSGGQAHVYLPSISTADLSATQQVVDLVNQERAKQGCLPLGISPQLSAAAQAHSQDMALNDRFSHSGSDGSTPWERIQDAGYRFRVVAENVAAGQPSPAAVMAAWMSSSGHRAHILDCELHDIGVGFYDQPDDQPDVWLDNGAISGPFRYYWTQDFGTP